MEGDLPGLALEVQLSELRTDDAGDRYFHPRQRERRPEIGQGLAGGRAVRGREPGLDLLQRLDPVPDPARGGCLAFGIEPVELVVGDRAGAREPLAGLDPRLPADVGAQIGMGEGERQALGRDRLTDSFVHPEGERGGRDRHIQRRLALEQIRVEEAREQIGVLLGDQAEHRAGAEQERCALPIAGPGKAEDPGLVGRRKLRARRQQFAERLFLAEQECDVEMAAKDPRVVAWGAFEQRIGGLQRAHLQELVDPGEEHLAPVAARSPRRVELGEQDGLQERLQRRQHFGALGDDPAGDVLGPRRAPESGRQAGHRGRQDADRVGLRAEVVERGDRDRVERRRGGQGARAVCARQDRRHQDGGGQLRTGAGGRGRFARRRHGDTVRQPVDRRERRVAGLGRRFSRVLRRGGGGECEERGDQRPSQAHRGAQARRVLWVRDRPCSRAAAVASSPHPGSP